MFLYHKAVELLTLAQVVKVDTGPCFHNATVEALCRLKLSHLCLFAIKSRVSLKHSEIQMGCMDCGECMV